MNKNRNLLWRSISVAVLAGACGVAAADTHPALDRISISLGAYQADSDADARVNGSAGVLGSNVNFEDDFGLTKDREVDGGRFVAVLAESFDEADFRPRQTRICSRIGRFRRSRGSDAQLRARCRKNSSHWPYSTLTAALAATQQKALVGGQGYGRNRQCG